ncbi:uncharacterized protein LOC124204897 isoform X1 [Daphnia pulex]|uniref:uncharacterized protein LOC124204897 isoform X1 n=1 Tax=Daphnia pulex TaxID=6669 RepID=UPI001EDE16D0|nr:uncharacterized protein LOC124204897 isoform X1 [Daphnia pulex]
MSLTDFITTNVRQSFDNEGDDKDHKEKITHFGRIQSEFEYHKGELKTINREIKLTGLLMGYSQHEEKIKQSLLALHQYLEHPDENNRHIFMREAASLTSSISVIVDGLLGQNAFNPDIMAVMLDSIGVSNVQIKIYKIKLPFWLIFPHYGQCHGRQLHKKIKFIMSIVMTGLWVRGEYQRMRNLTELDSSHFKNFILTSTIKLTKRLDDMVIDCQADEKNVSQEMRKIMKSQTSRGIKSIADSLLNFLEDKYDTKKWIVVVLPNLSENLIATHGNWSGITSEKWHYVLEKRNNRSGRFGESKRLVKIRLPIGQ